jgi:hypothetical protein
MRNRIPSCAHLVASLFLLVTFSSHLLVTQWNHFTILKPKSEQLNKPITAVLAAASMIGIMPLEFITKVDADPTKRFRLCS